MTVQELLREPQAEVQGMSMGRFALGALTNSEDVESPQLRKEVR